MKSRCHESGVALLDYEGNVLFAMNEERLSRKKLDGDFPEKSIAAMLEYTGIKPEEIAVVAVPTLSLFAKMMRFGQFLLRERLKRIFRPSTWRAVWKIIIKEKTVAKIKNQEQEDFVMKYFWRDFIKDHFPQAKIVEVDHHLSHAASAYYTSPWREALVLTMDGAGNLLSSIVGYGHEGKITIIDKTFIPHSAGTFWGSITKTCGFQSGTRHGGKVTGLAAYGKAEKLIDKMRKVISCRGLRFEAREEVFFDPSQLVPSWNSYQPQRMKDFLGEATREDIAAAAQRRLEEVVCELVRNACKKIKFRKIVCAGGVFANVLLNQKILELPEIDDIYIFPAMSDGGIAMGAAFHTLAQIKRREGVKLLSRPIGKVYLGPSYSRGEVEKYLISIGAKFAEPENLPKALAKLIHEGKVVALSQGRMEYGPRALGNRSILYAPLDPKVNDWLNARLRRSEFMPFAPVTLFEHIKECYIGISDEPLAAKYMTITYQCTDKMKKEAPACVHLDGTARPQVIKREDNPVYYDIVKEYYSLTGIPTLINTSFNMHEEPIVCTPQDAVRAFLVAKLDYLALSNFLLSFEDNSHLAGKL